MKACEFWHYLQVFNWIIIGYRAYKRWQGGSITQFHSISKSNYTEPVCRSIISSIRICLGFIYIYGIYRVDIDFGHLIVWARTQWAPRRGNASL